MHQGVIDLSTTFAEQDGKLFVGRSQDCTAIAEYAKRRHNEGDVGTAEMKYAAKIPSVIIEQYMNDNGVTFAEVMAEEVHIKRICEDPKNAMFRIWKGAL